MPVRREALIIQADTSPDSGRGVWRQALLDGNASIRELARFHLGKMGEIDWPELYRRALVENPQSLAALSGLGETGDRSDLFAIRGCLDSPLPSGRRAAVRAFAKVGGESALPDLLRYLQDDSPAVIREVRKHLEASPSSLDGEWLCRVAMEDHGIMYGRRHSDSLLRRGNGAACPGSSGPLHSQTVRRRSLHKDWSKHGSPRPVATVCSPGRDVRKGKRSSTLWIILVERWTRRF